MSASQLILDVGELIDILSPKINALREKHVVPKEVTNESLLAAWLSSALHDFDIQTDFVRPNANWELYSDLLNIKDDYALRLLGELIVPPVLQLFPPAPSLIARLLIQGRDLTLSY